MLKPAVNASTGFFAEVKIKEQHTTEAMKMINDETKMKLRELLFFFIFHHFQFFLKAQSSDELFP